MTTTHWRKSSYSFNTSGCVELAPAPSAALMRDSKHPDHGHITFAQTEVAALVDACTIGNLDHLADDHS